MMVLAVCTSVVIDYYVYNNDNLIAILACSVSRERNSLRGKIEMMVCRCSEGVENTVKESKTL